MGNCFKKNDVFKEQNNTRALNHDYYKGVSLMIPFFSYKGEIDQCLISKVYDGDTIHIIRTINKKQYRFRCRLLGIDTPEIKSLDIFEKKFAIETREYLSNLILDKKIWIEFNDFDKYGRILITIYLSEEDMKNKKSINQKLIDMGLAKGYDGKTKINFSDWNDS